MPELFPEGYRKWAVAVLAVVLDTLALALGWVGPDTWSDVMIWTVGLYVGGNVGEHWSRRAA